MTLRRTDTEDTERKTQSHKGLRDRKQGRNVDSREEGIGRQPGHELKMQEELHGHVSQGVRASPGG